jgi:hypothetical protein
MLAHRRQRVPENDNVFEKKQLNTTLEPNFFDRKILLYTVRGKKVKDAFEIHPNIYTSILNYNQHSINTILSIWFNFCLKTIPLSPLMIKLK